MTETKPRMKEAVALPIIVAAAAVSGVVIWLLARGAQHNGGWLRWGLLAMGAVSLLVAIFDREQKPDMKRINRTNAIMFLLGPTGSRILFGTIGGAFLGGAIALLLAPA